MGMGRKKKGYGTCSICLRENVEMTREHVPPKKAFNQNDVFFYSVDPSSASEVIWNKKSQQGGAWNYNLCESCNTKTGSWYGGAYVEFAKQCAEYLFITPMLKRVSCNFRQIYPLRIIKQMLAIICSTSGEGVVRANPWIGNFILNPNERNMPDKEIRVMAYLSAYRGVGRTTGIARILNTHTGAIRVISEFNWWPLGFALVFDRQRYPLYTDISLWASYCYDVRKDIGRDLMVLPISTAYPHDHRTREQLERDRAKQNT
ncbi:MAG: hypothetical protein AB1633_12740 [Elusimicrobiota bacterium]